MTCYTDYIGIDRTEVSRSNLYATDLPGVDLRVLDALTIDEQADYKEFFQIILGRAWKGLVSDLSKAMQDKFHVDYKLVSRETSQFTDNFNVTTGAAGILIQFDMPKYAVIHVISVSVYSETIYTSPDFVVSFNEEDEYGELLLEKSKIIGAGRNTINVDTDFSVDKLFISYDAGLYDLRKTENKHYNTGYTYYDKLYCTMPCSDGYGSVRQVNGGGLNVKYVISCSIEKFACENINLFALALWWRCGLELVIERRFGNKINEFTTMSLDDAEKLHEYYQTEYMKELTNAIGSQNVYEDPICFQCSGTVSTKTVLP